MQVKVFQEITKNLPSLTLVWSVVNFRKTLFYYKPHVERPSLPETTRSGKLIHMNYLPQATRS